MENRRAKIIIKVAFIGILGGLFSFLTFYFFNNFIDTFDFSFLWFVLLAAVLFLVFYTIQSFFVRDPVMLFTLSALQGLIPLGVFYPYLQTNISWYFIGIALAIFTGFLIVGSRSGFDNIENSVEIKFLPISDSVISKSFIGLLVLLMVFSYFYMFHLDNFSSDNSQALFDKVLESTEPALKIWFPGVTFSMNTGNVIDKMTTVQIERSKIQLLKEGVNFEELPEVSKNEMINEAEQQIKLTLKNFTGKEITPEKPLNVYLFESLNQWLSGFSETVKMFFEVGSFLLLFFIIKGLSFVIRIPVKIISFLVFKFLILVGFADLTIKQVSKEEIVI